jgi:hypothetical protein
MSSYRAAPQQGHVAAIIHIFGWLKQHPRSKMVFDYTMPQDVTGDEMGDITGWEDFYEDVKEELPPNAPEPRVRAVKQTVFIDSDLAGCTLTRLAHELALSCF